MHIFSRREFIDLLPFYLNNSLEIDQRKEVEDYLGTHPDAVSELDFSAKIFSAIRSSISKRSDTAGCEALRKRLADQRASSSLTSSETSAGTTE